MHDLECFVCSWRWLWSPASRVEGKYGKRFTGAKTEMCISLPQRPVARFVSRIKRFPVAPQGLAPPFSVNSGNGESLLVFSRAVLRGGSVGMDDEEGPATAGATAVPAGSVCVATVCVPHTKKGSRVPLGSFCTLEFRLGTKLSLKFASNVAVRAFTRGPRPPRSVQLLLFLFRASARAKISHFPVAPTLVVAVRPFLAHPETTIGPRVPSGISAKHSS